MKKRILKFSYLKNKKKYPYGCLGCASGQVLERYVKGKIEFFHTHTTTRAKGENIRRTRRRRRRRNVSISVSLSLSELLPHRTVDTRTHGGEKKEKKSFFSC
jgi:hypothetical protein